MIRFIPYFFLLPLFLVVGVVVFLIRQWLRMPKRGDPGYFRDSDASSYQMPSLSSDEADDGDGDG